MRIVLNVFDTMMMDTGCLCPNREVFGARSTVLFPDWTVQTETEQSIPAVTRVLESTKAAADSWPICMPSTRPTSYNNC